MKQHIWLVSGCRSGSHMVRRWSVQHLKWKYLLILIHCHTHINISCMLSQQVFATQTTSASCQSPSTTGRSDSWSHITPVCEVIQAGGVRGHNWTHLMWHRSCNFAGFVPNTSDDEGRYSIGAQANVGLFNLQKLLMALGPVLSEKQQKVWEYWYQGLKTSGVILGSLF